MALVNRGYLQYTDKKKFFKTLLLCNRSKRSVYGPFKNSGERSRAILALSFCFTTFVDKIIRGNMIYILSYQLVVNIEKYLAKKGKVHENN